MFPFSSLFAQVPLIILAAAYMIYFGAYALGKSKENIAENQPLINKNSVVVNQESLNNPTFYYTKYSEINEDIIAVDSKSEISFGSDVLLRFYVPDSKICSSFRCYYLFSRPPPCLG